MKIPAEVKPEWITIVQDSREQTPWNLSPMNVEVGTLSAGDYSVKSLTDIIALERKELNDAINCVGSERERFEREVQRLLAYPVRAILVEASWQDIEAGRWRSEVTSAAAMGSFLGWIARGLPVVMCGNRERAQTFAKRILYTAARRRWREARGLLARLDEPADPNPRGE
jgi:ERCC4-type nuclease